VNVLLGLLAGGAIGAAIGMLWAPHKGTVLRRNIRRKGEAIVDEVVENIEENVGHISDVVAEKVQEARKELKSRLG
jgi:gas vesicle protein